MKTNILNPDAFTELLHLSDTLGQNCLFSTVTWLLLCFLTYSISAITVFGSDSSKPEINHGPEDITPNIVSSKHHHFEAPLNEPFIYSSLKHSSLNLAYSPRSCVQEIYTCSTKLSSSLLQPATPQPISEKEQQWHQNWYIPQKKHLSNNCLSEKRPIRF